MAATISDVPILIASLVNKECSNVPLDSRRILEWQCVQECGMMWKESVSKRSKYTKCPKCEPKGRKAKVYSTGVMVENTVTNSECPVCVLSGLVMVTCGSCEFACCVTCIKTYILSTSFEAKCMKCETKYSAKYMVEIFGKSWYVSKNEGGYAHHLIKVWVEEEKAKFPITYPLIPVYREYKSIVHKLTGFGVKRKQILKRAKVTNVDKLSQHDATLYREAIANQETLMLNLRVNMDTLHGGEEANVVQKYIQGCPNENCKGMIENETFKCAVCDVQVCEKCHVQIQENHVCLLSDLETIQSMTLNTKPCPGCATPIYKIDGCDQMWCVMCKLAFSWTTGRTEKGRVHNPHYYAWARANAVNGEIPRERDNECGVPHSITFLQLVLRASPDYNQWMKTVFTRIYTAATEPPVIVTTNERTLTMARLAYLNSDIIEKRWVEKVHKIKNWIRESNSLHELRTGTVALLSEMLIAFYMDLTKPCNVDDVIAAFQISVEKARLYINECIHNEFVYKSKNLYDVYNKEWKYVHADTDILV